MIAESTRWFSLALLCLLALAFAVTGAEEDDRDEQDEEDRWRTVVEGEGYGDIVLGATVAQIVKDLGKPEKKEDAPHPKLVYRRPEDRDEARRGPGCLREARPRRAGEG